MPRSETEAGRDQEGDATPMDMLTPLEQSTAPAFDYSALPAEVAPRQRERADRIRGMYRQTVETAGEIGRELLAAQSEMDHGQFLPWVTGAVGLSKSTAYRCMDMARSFGPKLPTVGSLPLAVVHKLAEKSTPEPVRAAVLRRIEAGETVSPETILHEVREGREQARQRVASEKEEARRAKLTPEARAKEDAQNKRKVRTQAVREAELEQERKEMREAREHRAKLAEEAAAAFIKKFGADDGLAFLRKFSRVHWNEAAETACLMFIAKFYTPDDVDIKELDVRSDWTLRSQYTSEEIEEAAREITDAGEEYPITLIRITDREHIRKGLYRIVEGELRVLAIRDVLRRTTVLARILPAPDASPANE